MNDVDKVNLDEKILDEFENAILTNTDRTVSGYRRFDVIHVKIVKIDYDCLLVDVGRKSEVFIPIEEVVHDPNLPLDQQYKVGDEIPVKVIRDEKSKGGIFLSHRKAVYQTQVDKIEKAFQDQTSIPSIVREKVKGGLIVDINGIQAFLPISLIGMRKESNLDQFIGKEMDVRIIEFDNQKRKVVVSRKAIDEEEGFKKRTEFMASLEVNEVLEGTVTNLVEYGAFVDIGHYVEGLVHVSELSWGNTKRPYDILKKGQKINVRVIGISDDRQKISLSYKRTLEDPWDLIQGKYNLGQIVEGPLIKDLNFGAIVELEEGINAFMHISQVSNKRISSIGEIFEIGDMVKAEIVEIDLSQKKIKLSRRSILPPEEEADTEDQNESPRGEIKRDDSNDFSSFVDVFVPKKTD